MTRRRIYPEWINLKWRTRYSRAQAQARYRREPWEFDIESWYQIWQASGVQDQIGHTMQSYTMVRRDIDHPWSANNCMIMRRDIMMLTISRHHWESSKRFPESEAHYIPGETS